MKAQVVDGWPKDNKIRIILSETNAAQVNSLRRAILTDVRRWQSQRFVSSRELLRITKEKLSSRLTYFLMKY